MWNSRVHRGSPCGMNLGCKGEWCSTLNLCILNPIIHTEGTKIRIKNQTVFHVAYADIID